MFRLTTALFLAAATPFSVFAQPTTFDAASILPANIVNGSTYRIAPQVQVQDHRFQFLIETRSGTFPASGILMLEKRLSELHAIERAAELGQGAVALEEAWKTIRRTPDGARHLLLDPLGTLGSAPTGFRRMASSVTNPVDRRVGSKTKRQLAANLGVDSETRNPVLRHMLTELAARKLVGSAATKFGLSLAVPGLGSLSTIEDLRDELVSKAPHEIVADIDRELTRLKVWKPIQDQFVRNPRWTILEKMTFMSFYRQLADVQHADVMVYLANQDATEADVLRRLVELQLLAQLHQTNGIASISDGGLPVTVLRDGSIVGVCSVDYLVNTEAVKTAASAFRQANPEKSLTLVSTGRISPAAQQTLNSNRIRFQNVSFGEVTKQAARQRTEGQR